MDKETIQQIATEVVARLPYGDRYWLFLIVNVVVMALVGSLAALGTSYFRTRGQNLATKHDFASLQEQLRTTTQAVETIKSEVGQKDWAQREWTNLRRTKLEALLEKMHDCDTYLDQHRHRFMEGKGPDPQQRDHLNDLDTIGTLYFPELENEIYRFYCRGKEQITVGLELARALNSAGNDMAARDRAYDTFRKKWGECHIEHMDARSALRDAARRLLIEIMGVED